MYARLLAVLSVFLIVGAAVPFLVCDDGSDGASLDGAPDAEHVVDLGDYTILKGSASRSFDLLDAYENAVGDAPLSTLQAIYIGGFDTKGLPGWITVEKSYTGTMYEDFVPDIQLVVQTTHVAASTDYWLYSGLLGGILWTITVEVEDSDPTITPSETYSYELSFDSRGGSAVSPVRIDNAHSSAVIDLAAYVPEMGGHKFIGWTEDVSSGRIVTSITLEGEPGTTVTKTLYAVWQVVDEEEPEHIVLPTLFDGLIQILSDPLILLIIIAVFLAVCLFIRNRTGGYY